MNYLRAMDIEANKAIGAKLRDIRKRIPLTQIELAERLDKPQSYVSKIEMGERALQVSELPSYSNALETNPNDLISRLFESGS